MTANEFLARTFEAADEMALRLAGTPHDSQEEWLDADVVFCFRFDRDTCSLERFFLGGFFCRGRDAKPYGRLGQVHNSHLLNTFRKRGPSGGQEDKTTRRLAERRLQDEEELQRLYRGAMCSPRIRFTRKAPQAELRVPCAPTPD